MESDNPTSLVRSEGFKNFNLASDMLSVTKMKLTYLDKFL
jgi:hypothetical protein